MFHRTANIPVRSGGIPVRSSGVDSGLAHGAAVGGGSAGGEHRRSSHHTRHSHSVPRAVSGSSVVRRLTLAPGHELRLITRDDETATLRLVGGASAASGVRSKQHVPSSNTGVGPASGTAEIFGAEMAPDTDYELPRSERCAVFTWGGCTLQISGHMYQEYEASNFAMREYLNVSSILDFRRQVAGLSHKIGPRVLVLGAPSSGKSTICLIMSNYAIRKGWTPTFVELDPRGSTDKEFIRHLPGTIGATVLEGYVPSPEGPDQLHFFFGCSEPESNLELYQRLCCLLSSAIHARFMSSLGDCLSAEEDDKTVGADDVRVDEYFVQSDVDGKSGKLRKQRNGCGVNKKELFPREAASGCIINSTNQPSIQTIEKIIETFGVDVVLVIDDPSMKNFLSERYNYKEPEMEGAEGGRDLSSSSPPPILSSASSVVVIGLPKPEGVVAVTSDRLATLRRTAWRNYFHGEDSDRGGASGDGVVGSGNQVPAALSTRRALRIKASDYKFVCLDASRMSASLLPMGQSEAITEEYMKIAPFNGRMKGLVNAILAVPAEKNPQKIAWSCVAFFVVVKRVEELASSDLPTAAKPTVADYVIDLFAPNGFESDRLPSPYLLVADRTLKWAPDL